MTTKKNNKNNKCSCNHGCKENDVTIKLSRYESLVQSETILNTLLTVFRLTPSFKLESTLSEMGYEMYQEPTN